MYLIIATDDATTSVRVSSKFSVRNFTDVAKHLQRRFPGKRLVNPLSTLPAGMAAQKVVTYLSDDEGGVGRVAEQFQEWMVER